jgi:gluconate 2-dehydrogenase gamma chain
MNCDRREFIKRAGFLTGSLMLIPACNPPWPYYRTFSNDEAACLIALCEQIIPADEYPGATDAGVINYIDKQIALRFPEEKEVFCKSLLHIQDYCKTVHKSLFEELQPETQIEIMKKIEEGELQGQNWENNSQRQFFNKLIDRSMQGFYGSPRHGGNKNYLSYRMLKLDYPLLIAQNRYKR